MNYKMKILRKYCLDNAELWVNASVPNPDKAKAYINVAEMIDKLERNYDGYIETKAIKGRGTGNGISTANKDSEEVVSGR